MTVDTDTAYPASTEAAPEVGYTGYTIGSVLSRDGTTIGYRRLGRGPGVVLLHGSMESAESHMQLAQALAGSFTVYLPDRRGRGLSGPYGKDYSVQEDMEDISALLEGTRAHCIFGVSSGGIICLQAARTLAAVHRVAVYEPALSVNGSISTAFLSRYDRDSRRQGCRSACYCHERRANGAGCIQHRAWRADRAAHEGNAQE